MVDQLQEQNFIVQSNVAEKKQTFNRYGFLRKQFNLSIFITILAGMALAVFILTYAGLATRWIVSYSIALIIILIGMMGENPSRFCLVLFFFTLPVVSANYIGQLSRLHYGGPPGLYFTFYDFPLLMIYLFWIPKLFILKTAQVRFSKLDLFMFGLIGMSFLSMYNAVETKLCLYAICRLIIMYLIFF